MPPSVYFRALLLAYLLGIESERAVALQAGDSLSARRFLGYALHARTPSRSALARARRRIPVATQRKVFVWALDRLREARSGGAKPAPARQVGKPASGASVPIVRVPRGPTGTYATFLRQLANQEHSMAGQRAA